MVSRALAGLLVLVLIGPSVVTATCELTCAMASHHHGKPSSSAASCHEHQGSTQNGVSATSPTLCHESEDLPSAVVDAWLNTVLASAISAITVVVMAPPIAARAIAPVPERSAAFDPRPANRPLRV